MVSPLSKQLNVPVAEAAQMLLGAELTRLIDGQKVNVKIVETEAYDDQDEASHTFKGMTPRTAIMYGPAGFAYVYFTYGMHYCFNIVTGESGRGSAVLVRAVEPLSGQSVIEANRFPKTGYQLTNGPAKVCQALQINKELNCHDLNKEPFILTLKPRLAISLITTSTRVGISKAIDKPWRFYIAGNPYVSKL